MQSFLDILDIVICLVKKQIFDKENKYSAGKIKKRNAILICVYDRMKNNKQISFKIVSYIFSQILIIYACVYNTIFNTIIFVFFYFSNVQKKNVDDIYFLRTLRLFLDHSIPFSLNNSVSLPLNLLVFDESQYNGYAL